MLGANAGRCVLGLRIEREIRSARDAELARLYSVADRMTDDERMSSDAPIAPAIAAAGRPLLPRTLAVCFPKGVRVTGEDGKRRVLPTDVLCNAVWWYELPLHQQREARAKAMI